MPFSVPKHRFTRYRSEDGYEWGEFECRKCEIDIDCEDGDLKNGEVFSCPACGARGTIVFGPVINISKAG